MEDEVSKIEPFPVVVNKNSPLLTEKIPHLKRLKSRLLREVGSA
jgi:hypothetical protein